MGRFFLAAVVCLVVAGCGGGLETAPVSGVITLDGKPLENASVTFSPQARGGQAPISNGKTDAGGRYKLSVTATADPGAVVGKHTVRIAFIGQETDSDVSDPKGVDPIPPHDFTFEVKPGQNKADFDLKSQ